jgi:hypothetical protein
MNTLMAYAGIPGATVALATVVIALYRLGKKYLVRRSVLRKHLLQLACGTTLDYFDSLLGTPLSKVMLDHGRVQRIYRTPNAYVLATAPSTDRNVDGFSITIRKRKRRPPFTLRMRRLTVGQIDVDLLRVTFGHFYKRPEAHRFVNGANRFSYVESFYFGNPGNYQTYLLSYNDGAGDLLRIPIEAPSFATGNLQLSDAPLPVEPDKAKFDQVRRTMRINTLSVLSTASPEIVSTGHVVGVDRNAVRQIPE